MFATAEHLDGSPLSVSVTRRAVAAAGTPVQQAARKHRVVRQTVIVAANARGVSTARRRRFPELFDEDCVYEAYDSDDPIRVLAGRVGCSESSIYDAFARFDLPPRGDVRAQSSAA